MKREPKPAPIDPTLRRVMSAFARNRRVTYGGKGFGSTALKVNGKIFAMVASKGQFVVKLPPARVDELVHRGQGTYFDPGHGRLMKGWLTFTGPRRSWTAMAREACLYVQRASS